MIKGLEAVKGEGTSLVSLLIPPKDQIHRVATMLNNEYATAANIKSRVNRQSVQNAISSAIQRLKLYTNVPPNGLVIYCGLIVQKNRSEKPQTKMVNIDLEPPKPLNTTLYLCDNRFHVDGLKYLLEADTKYGFIIIDGHGCLFGMLSGDSKTVLSKFQVDLPPRQDRGGQSALRFSRIRMEKRHNYIRKVAETANKLYLADNKVAVDGIIVAGLADLKSELINSQLMDARISKKVLKLVDISCGGETGFNQAIEQSKELLGNVRFVQEKQILQQYFTEIAKTGTESGQRYCFGMADTMTALEMGAVESLIVYEDCALVVSSGESIVDWADENHQKYGVGQFIVVSNHTPEGTQFISGFGGFGGLLRYPVKFAQESYDDDSVTH